jgi:osmotically-inducible protein OsmY
MWPNEMAGRVGIERRCMSVGEMSVHGKGLNRAGSGVGKLHTLASLTRIIAFGVPESSPASHSDEDLATAILSALKWQEDFPKDAIQVEVERGCVTLAGEVDWGYQRHAAEMLVSRMRGVMGVSNQITVRADEVAANVGTQISAALARRAQREFAGIAIQVHDGVVTLTGTVSSLAEKRAACGAAWSAKGVQRVVDKLSVV